MFQKSSVARLLGNFLIFLLTFHFIYGQNTATGVTHLELNKLIEQKISGGQKHIYKITLAEREYVGILVEQIGVDLIIRVLDADGKQLYQFDERLIASGTERVGFAALANADFTLQIEPKSKTAPLADYKIIWKEKRPATEEDLAYLEARLLLYETSALQSAGKYKEAIALAERALQIIEKVYGAENERTAVTLNRLGILSTYMGDSAKAEIYLQRALAIYKLKGANDLNAADTMSNLSPIYRNKGDFAEAEKLLLQSLEIRQRELGQYHNLIGANYNNLGILYRRRGDNAKAQEMYQRSVEIREKLFGADSLEIAPTLANFASFYYFKGDYSTAIKIDERVLAIREKNLPPDHPSIGDSLNNMGIITADSGDPVKAEPLYLRALAIQEKKFGHENIIIAPTLNNLAKLYSERGEYDKAEVLLLRILCIAEAKLGNEHIDIPNYLKAAGDFYTLKGDYEKAENYLKRAFEMLEKFYGKDHFEVGRGCSSMARLYLFKNDPARAARFQECANRISEKYIQLNLAIGTEHEKLSYMKLLAEDLNQTINLQINSPKDKSAAEQAVTTILRRKGRVLDAMSESYTELRRRFDAQDRILLEKLNDTLAALAELTLNKPPNASLAEYEKRVSTLSEQKDKLESEISRKSAGFYESPVSIKLDAITALLPADSALLEFAVYKPILPTNGGNKSNYGEPRYVVYVVRQTDEVQAKDLGETKTIDAVIGEFRKAVRDPKRKDVKRFARDLDEKLMRPVRSLLGNAAQLLISPEGALNLIPFEALVNEKERYLIENYSIAYLTSGRELLRLKTARPSKNKSLIVANPLFGTTNEEAVATTKNGSKKSVTVTRNLSDTYFAPLGGTLEEARSIQNLFPDWTFLSGKEATVTNLKQTVAPQILHLATHGFFLEKEKETKKVENPLLRSGLVLAGANRRVPQNGDDGILTAFEASSLNLWGTKLVVLSACDTGLGEIETGEGVYGLRRAFTLAGTETLIMSLWSVSDYATRELMTDYYKNLKDGNGRGASLRKVQLEMLKKKERAHPFFWAGFIQSGEWANLDGKR